MTEKNNAIQNVAHTVAQFDKSARDREKRARQNVEDNLAPNIPLDKKDEVILHQAAALIEADIAPALPDEVYADLLEFLIPWTTPTSITHGDGRVEVFERLVDRRVVEEIAYRKGLNTTRALFKFLTTPLNICGFDNCIPLQFCDPDRADKLYAYLRQGEEVFVEQQLAAKMKQAEDREKNEREEREHRRREREARDRAQREIMEREASQNQQYSGA